MSCAPVMRRASTWTMPYVLVVASCVDRLGQVFHSWPMDESDRLWQFCKSHEYCEEVD